MTDPHQRPASLDDRGAGAARAPTHAERCRTLVRKAVAATLCTVARDRTMSKSDLPWWRG